MPFHSPRLNRIAGQDRLPRGLRLQARRAAAAICLTTFALLASGCSTMPNFRGDGYGDETAHWAESMRSPSSNVQGYGYSTRAQEIEHNLGVK